MLGRGSVGKTLGYASGERLSSNLQNPPTSWVWYPVHLQVQGKMGQTVPRSSVLASLVLTGKEPTSL